MYSMVYFFTFAIVNKIASATNCIAVAPNYTLKQFLTVNGDERNISLYWGSETAHAASALLAIVLRDKLGYQNVKLVQGPNDLRNLAASVIHGWIDQYEEGILAISAAWEPSRSYNWEPNLRYLPGLAGPRMGEFGKSSVPIRHQLYVHIVGQYQRSEQCTKFNQWNFYTNIIDLKRCGFSLCGYHLESIIVYGPESAETAMSKLKERSQIPPLEFKTVNRSVLLQMLRSNQSFLFLDYAMWTGYKDVSPVQLPSCIPIVNATCQQDLDSIIEMKMADTQLFQEYAPQILEVAHNFYPSPDSIRNILERQSEGINMEQAACEWAQKYNTRLHSWIKTTKEYQIIIFTSNDDPDHIKYGSLISYLNVNVPKLYDSKNTDFDISISHSSHCHNVKWVLNNKMSSISRETLIGAIVGCMNNATSVVKSVDGSELPILFYDAPEIDADTTKSTWVTSGRTIHLALALRHFIRSMNWTRVGVLSDPTELSKRLIDDLKVDDAIGFGNHDISHNLTQSDAERNLKILKEENANIILLNTNYKNVATILTAAVKLEMNSVKEYAWIVRDWRPNNATLGINHFTISFSCFCGENIPNDVGNFEIRQNMTKLWGNCTFNQENSWPAHSTAFADATLTLYHGFHSLILRRPELRNDKHHKKAIKAFGEELMKPFQGVTQLLKYKDHSLDEIIVYLDEWQGHKRSHLTRWRINSTGIIDPQHYSYNPYSHTERPHDGSLVRCITVSGGKYHQTCKDVLIISIMAAILLATLFIILTYRIVSRRLRERREKLLYALLTQRQQCIEELTSSYIVDRSAVTLQEKIGAGRFGIVHLAVLRTPQGTTRYIAAKVLHDTEGESEILREACILTSLTHNHIIRLVGVCFEQNSPIVLMEVAFFRDLLRYLSERRYLVEDTNTHSIESDKSAEEAAHVSAEALTRLALQATTALEYLSSRHIIHRDIRAANCLVDVHRSLKLADFGLARQTISSDDGAEYTSRRRGLFPVLWMAPESLTQGIFSNASDIWALGVLILELVTLGQRPFGDMSPLRVMQFVAAGGQPPIPRDATPQTIGLMRLCWKREPEQRPTAANIVSYLTDRKDALRPALDCEHWRSEDYIFKSSEDHGLNAKQRSTIASHKFASLQELRLNSSF